MPFGEKPDATGMMKIDFDAIYRDLIAPAITEVGLDPLRADEEVTGGIIHKPMYERLLFSQYAVADLTTANANVFYELGVRHAVRPWSTVLLFAGSARLPFDVGPLRAMLYRLTPAGTLEDVASDRRKLVKQLKEIRKQADIEAKPDSPLFQMISDLPTLAITDARRTELENRAQEADQMRAQIADAKRRNVEALREVERRLGRLTTIETGIVIDLFLAYRDRAAWADVVALFNKMPKELQKTVMVQEQFALALNRAGQGEEAEDVLKKLIERRGPSSETYGILGRVYKDRWEQALKQGATFEAQGLLAQAIDAYLKGFEADWRDAYPGVNVVTLMEIKQPPDPRRKQILPVVAYAVERRIAAGTPDYWDYATRLELAVLAKDKRLATSALGAALASVRAFWEPETTARNLRLIREARARRGEEVVWAKSIEEALEAKAHQQSGV